jgi:hypothetical protein
MAITSQVAAGGGSTKHICKLSEFSIWQAKTPLIAKQDEMGPTDIFPLLLPGKFYENPPHNI